MTIETFVALIAFLFPLAYSPGPGNTFFAAIGASKGLRLAIPALAGYHVATFVVTAAIGLGLGMTVLNEPVFAKILSAIGSCYVLWLGIQFLRAARAKSSGEARQDSPAPGLGFKDGAVVLLLNPKAYYIIGLLFTQFLHPDDERLWQVLSITTVFTLNNLLAFIAWALGGAALTHLFRGANAGKWIDYVFAASLIGVAIWMAVPLFA
ncbi:LysE family translocator [Luethyella okanaganae]|uniref:LysE family translocator n=1 Tax=Luethyella okanaganae TaxID=69372 RepID=A0ABW1VFQ8_9MICO